MSEYDGLVLWDEFNSLFDNLSLCAVIDDSTFCVHGGLPRSISTSSVDFFKQLQSTVYFKNKTKHYNTLQFIIKTFHFSFSFSFSFFSLLAIQETV